MSGHDGDGPGLDDFEYSLTKREMGLKDEQEMLAHVRQVTSNITGMRYPVGDMDEESINSILYDSDLPPKSNEQHPLSLFKRAKEQGRPLHVCGPMVRYSKLPFRALVRLYGADLVYTPMMLAREFVRNQRARDCDFTTNSWDRPLVVQFGASNEADFSRSAELVAPYCNAIGLNCGCPIKDQVREGIGASLMGDADRICRLVRAAKASVGQDFCVETKLRILPDQRKTIEFVRQVEASGVDYITIHGRTKNQRSSDPSDLETVRLIKSIVKCPVVANGDAFSLSDVDYIANKTGVDGVMAVRGILANPAMFAGYKSTPWSAVEHFWDLVTAYPLPYRLAQHHFHQMMGEQLDSHYPCVDRDTGLVCRSMEPPMISKREKSELMDSNDLTHLLDWFDSNFLLRRRSDPWFGKIDTVHRYARAGKL